MTDTAKEQPDFRALILEMADELDRARQLYLDDRRAKCPLAAKARAVLARCPTS